MESKVIRKKFLDFFEKRGHYILKSASLVTSDEKGTINPTLFNTAGMQPLIPYLLGKKHPEGKKLASSQKCLRTVDIDEVGDNTHLTFFEMLGNWSLGDYFKEKAIKWSYEFLINKEEGLGLDPKRLYVTVFAGDEDVPRDNEAVEIWEKYIPKNRIYFRGKKDNWWTAGDNSPAGPSSEMFYDIEGNLGDLSSEEFQKADEEQKVVEIWNDVFMTYKQEEGKVVGELPQKNIDTGAGLERIAMIMQGKDNVFETDLFEEAMAKIKKLATNYDEKFARIVLDHLRSSVFIIAEGVSPSNKDRGYILRRLIRRAIHFAFQSGLNEQNIFSITEILIKELVFSEWRKQKIIGEVVVEIDKFKKTLEKGLREFEKGERDAFLLFTTYGFPLEMTVELAKEKGEEVDVVGFGKKIKEHQKLSKTASAGMFKGGLADGGEETTQLHTVAHLLLAGLRKFLGDNVKQAGSNINSERLRFDFTYLEKVPEEKIEKVEEFINDILDQGCEISFEEMKKDDAIKVGVTGNFWDRYPDTVKVYSVKDKDGKMFSRELCGGPHVKNTSEIKGKFKIVKESASSAGVRRIKAVLVKE